MDKLNLIESLQESKSSILRLKEMAFDEDEEVRLRSVEKLAMYQNDKEIIPIIRSTLLDNDELVLSESIDYLGLKQDQKSLEEIIKLTNHASPLVRSSAYIASTQICKQAELLPFVTLNTKELDQEEIAPLAISKYLLDLASAKEISLLLHHSNYIVRCSASNLISYYAKIQDINYFITSLHQVALFEESTAVKSAVDSALETLSHYE